MDAAAKTDVCSIGAALKEQCHVTTFTKKVGKKTINEFNESEIEILKLRTKLDSIESLCFHHEKVYFSMFDHTHGKYCCDPFKRHPKFIKSKILIF